MIAVPFFYFSFLLLFILKTKRTFDISAYLVSMYAVSGLFSILIDLYNLRSFDTQSYQIGIVPTFLYCFLLTLTVWPFMRIKTREIGYIHLSSPRLFNYISYFFFACFLFILFTSFSSIIQILGSDLGELRTSLGKGENVVDIPRGGGILRPFVIISNIFGGYSLIMLLFYFYSICFLNKSQKFNTLLLMSSSTIILIGILGVDRSKTVYWILTYGLMTILFWDNLTKAKRRKIIRISTVVLGLTFVYIFAITISRFGDRHSGTEGGMISYLGQSFINFCFFFENVEFRDFSLQRIFPLFYTVFVDNGIDNSVQLNEHLTLRTGKNTAVFSTFIGDILVASGKFVAIIYCFCFAVFARMVTNFRNPNQLYFYDLLILYCVISVPLYGLFVYFYASFARVIPLLFFIILGLYLKVEKLRK